MSATDSASTAPALRLDDCWNRIGVRGDRSCPELKTHLHCRNCPVHAAAVATLLDRELPAGHLERWTEHFAQPSAVHEAGLHAIVIFRIGREWLALPTAVFLEVAALRPIHTLPHRRNTTVQGLVNVRGELLLCFSAASVLGLTETAPDPDEAGRKINRRLLVLSRDGQRLVLPVDEVGGTHRYHPRDLLPPPATVARATATYTKAVLNWRNHTVGCLDDELLFYSLNRSIA